MALATTDEVRPERAQAAGDGTDGELTGPLTGGRDLGGRSSHASSSQSSIARRRIAW
ncbi:hypothetical protein [Nonomuraea sp. NPDC049158]|uniref:hypothetical protein n=1 Tax=Nonomuraea sp. NPDC049158 TaxID=3155649 RepID=UPI0033D94636